MSIFVQSKHQVNKVKDVTFSVLLASSQSLKPLNVSFRVEELHSGDETNTVLYIPVGPDCPSNRTYIEKAKKCFLDGKCPPDFGMSNVQCESDFEDRATLDDLNDDAKVMMGFD